MKYSMTALQTDVMARLGEIARPQGALDSGGVPWPEDIVALRVSALLAEIGSRLLMDASAEALGGALRLLSDSDVGMRLMPCGLYGAEVRLPEGFLRLASVKMAGWRRSVVDLIGPDSAEWAGQWSPEPGIAGCPDRPRAYLDRDSEGLLLRLVGSESGEDVPEWLGVVDVPVVDGAGGFDFPESLYPELVGNIARDLVG